MDKVRVRFAPSPTGTLHVGSARTAVYNYLFARSRGGTVVLRIEDTDIKRSLRRHEESIIRDLHWLGLSPDEGPESGGNYGPYRQSGRTDIYAEGVRRLLASGDAYHCFCTQERLEALKQEQLARGDMPKYDRRCLALGEEQVEERLAAGEEATVRFKVPTGETAFLDLIHGPINFSSEVIGDFIVKRTDGGYAYNYAVVMDDAGMKITHVIRGEDHITNTARQLMLYKALGEPAPEYAHHSLIMGPDGGKLSKRHGATSIGEFRDMGYLPQAVANYLALLSWHPKNEEEKFGLDEVVSEFDIGRVSKSAAIFDMDKLNWLNGLYARELSPEDLAEKIRPYLEEEGIRLAAEQEATVAAAVQSNLVSLNEAPHYAEVFVAPLDLGASEHAGLLHEDGVETVLQLLAERLEGEDREYLDPETARGVLKELAAECKERGIKGRSVYKPLRVALTGQDSGPELFYLLAGMGLSVVLRRLAEARSFVMGNGGV